MPGTLSVVIPAHNEEANIAGTVHHLVEALRAADISHEILVVNDSSTDATERVLVLLPARLVEIFRASGDGRLMIIRWF